MFPETLSGGRAGISTGTGRRRHDDDRIDIRIPGAAMISRTALLKRRIGSSVLVLALLCASLASPFVAADSTRGRLKVAATGSQPAGEPFTLRIGLTRNGDGSSCGTETEVTVELGDTVDFCYTVTNHSSTPLAFSSLEDGLDGLLFSNRPTPIAANGGTYVHHRSIVATTEGVQVHSARWMAWERSIDYTHDDTADVPFVDISGTGTPVPLADDQRVALTIPFVFRFYGVPTTGLCLANNGGIVIGRDAIQCASYALYASNGPLPTSMTDAAAIFPYWDDFNSGSGAINDGLYWEVRGQPGERELIVQWNKPRIWPWPDPTPQKANFEAILREDGSFSFVYDHLAFGATAYPQWDNGGSATIGIQNADGSAWTQYSYDTVLTRLPPFAVEWTMDAPAFTAQASVAVTGGAARMALAPEAIEAAAASGSAGPVNATLAIANEGSLDLVWSAAELPSSRAHFPRSARRVTPRDPVLASARLDADARAALGSVPAYAFGTRGNGYFWSLDVLRPEFLTALRIGWPIPGISGATFADNDFSRLYVVSFDGVFGFVDTEYGDLTVVGQVELPDGIGGLGGLQWDASNGKLYATASTNDRFQYLFTIDRDTGQARLVGEIAIPGTIERLGVRGIAVAPSGLMYGVDSVRGRLLAIDKATGEAADIGPLGLQLPVPIDLSLAGTSAQLAFDPQDGTLYLAASESWRRDGEAYFDSNMYLVDPLSGAATVLGPIFGAPSTMFQAMAIARASRTCVLPGDVPWLSVAPASGTVAVGGAPAETTLTFDPAGLPDGRYTADLCVSSNDPRHLLSVPIRFTVGTVAPRASVAPAALALTIEAGRSHVETLTLANAGAPGSVLSFTVSEAVSDCSAPADLSWLRLIAASGDVQSGAAGQSPAVAFDTAGLATGPHEALLCVTSNDPDHPLIEIPVVLTVAPSDAVFVDGFEARGGDHPGIYADRATFLTRLAPDYYENPFANVTINSGRLGYRYRQEPYAYSVTTDDGAGFLSVSLPGVVMPYDAASKIVLTFTGAPVTAVGGRFWATDANETAVARKVVVELSDGTKETWTTVGPGDFRGFTAPVPIERMTIDAEDSLSPLVWSWVTMDDLIVGTNAFAR